MAKTKVVEINEEMTGAQLKRKVVRMAEIKAEIKTMNKEFDGLEKEVIDYVGVGNWVESGSWRVCVVQAWQRRVNWKNLAMSLAKTLYPEARAFRAWLKSVVRANRKKAAAPFAKLTAVKE